MANYRFQVTIPAATGLPEDGFVNVWHTKTAGAVAPADWDNAISDILDFYAGLYTLMPNGVVSTAVGAGKVKAYSVDPGSPGEGDDTSLLLDEDAFTVPAVASAANLPLPTEVALCMGMVAVGAATVPEETGTIRPRSRYRGRVYLGPWASSSTTVALAGGSSRPGAGLIAAILNYGDALGTALQADGHSLCVYSRADAAFKTVDTLQCDDSWDTVRSRGVKRTLRDTRAI